MSATRSNAEDGMPDAPRTYLQATKVEYAIVLAVCVVDGADMAVLGAAFRYFERDLGLTPVTLGMLTLAQAFAMALAAPVWGWMNDSGRASRRELWIGGAIGWAAVMLSLALCVRPALVFLLRVINGLFLACLGPLTQSWVAERVAPKNSGRTFALLVGATHVGSAMCTMLINTYGGSKVPLPFLPIAYADGWRVVCAGIGFASCGLALLIWCCMTESGERARKTGNMELSKGPAEIVKNLKEHWSIHTFRIIVFQGVVGGIPWSALSFKMMFFQYMGMSKEQINLLVACELPASIIGVMLGGLMGDMGARISAAHGRTVIGQICVSIGIPLMMLQVQSLPTLGTDYIWPFLITNTLFYLTATWTPAGLIRPIFLEVTKPHCRASVVAWESAIEGIAAAVLGAPLVGFLAEDVFGYKATTAEISDMTHDLRQHNFEALQTSLSVMTTVPWLACFLAITLLHWYYPQDIARLKSASTEDLALKSEAKLTDAGQYRACTCSDADKTV
mmetsp:Transcript_20382/g.44413  ORF Transcript_20382/g.44413 Transcript_20382/m.44413 type:complete len:505 (-) Transcript_20382:103-1617(-)